MFHTQMPKSKKWENKLYRFRFRRSRWQIYGLTVFVVHSFSFMCACGSVDPSLAREWTMAGLKYFFSLLAPMNSAWFLYLRIP